MAVVADLDLAYTVLLPGRMILSPSDVHYQIAHAGDFNCEGLNTFTIAFMIVVTVAVCLRLWSRRIESIEWRSDDYTLIAGLILSLGAQACSLNLTYNGGFCRHTYINYLDRARWEQFGKTAYAWNVLYTISYPVSRISLALLYRRVFIQQWVRSVCWFVIICYIGYAIGSTIADLCEAFPLRSNWDSSIEATRHINGKSLFLANTGFNIATDTILLVLPLVVIWKLWGSWLHKLGLSVIFCLGALTVIASIARLVYYCVFDTNDPMWALTPTQFWTIAEMNLGLLCPCLVTLGPLIRISYLVVATRLSSHARQRLESITGITSADVLGNQRAKAELGATESSATRVNAKGFQPSLHSESSQLEAGTYNDTAPCVPRTAAAQKGRSKYSHKLGLSADQDIALANLDPRRRDMDSKEGDQRLGVSTTAVAQDLSICVPSQGIGVSRDWRLYSE